jgi:ABC-2 type transport system permease protein
MSFILDYVQLLKAFYRAAWIEATKSPINFWISSLVQITFYIAQILFWVGIRSTSAGKHFMNDRDLLGFLLTLCAVDNLYLFLLGPGSVQLMNRILKQNLDSLLMWPRSTLGVLVFFKPNFNFLPMAALSLVLMSAYHLYHQTALSLILLHSISIVIGIFILNAISFIYRLSAFWTRSIVDIRNSNPSFKIIVRPFDSFSGMAKLFLLTVFPALFITGVPSKILKSNFAFVWLFGSIGAATLLWLYVAILWQHGLKRYGKKAN